MPRIYLTKIPSWWKDKDVDKITVAVKKRLFFRLLGPVVLHSNELILAERERLQNIAGQDFYEREDREWLLSLARKYRVNDNFLYTVREIMLQIELDEVNGIATLRPDGPLTEDGFKNASNSIDPYIEKSGRLKGLIIETEAFPGWESFSAFLHHFQFVKEHHKKIGYIALVTDSAIGDMAEKITNHFVAAEIRHFSSGDMESARSWIIES